MSIAFTPKSIGTMVVPNRFVASATYEAMAGARGEVTDQLVLRYRNLAKGGAGLIITGLCYVHPSGHSMPKQIGAYGDAMVAELRRIVDAVHQEGGRIAIQLMLGGMQVDKSVGEALPLAPSAGVRSPVSMIKSRQMSGERIQEAIRAFGAASRRVADAGADAIQVHAAHGYLIHEFLSPFFNRRTDAWGGTDENRFRFLKEVLAEVRKAAVNLPVLVKLNTNDFSKPEGITPPLAAKYAQWLADLGVDAVETSAGTVHFDYLGMIRGTNPVDELARMFPAWQGPIARRIIRSRPARPAVEACNLEAAKLAKTGMGTVPLILVGGMRSLGKAEEILQDGGADFIAMARPFIREPDLVRRFQEGKAASSTCISCNRCFAASGLGFPTRCYRDGLPGGASR